MSEITITSDEDKVRFERELGDEVVRLLHDPHVGDWIVVHETGNAIGQPGGIRDRADAIEYALYLLDVIEETDIFPQEKIE